MTRHLVLGVALAAILATGPATAAEIVPGMPSCLQSGANGVVSATLTPETGWSNVRVYFRESGTDAFYFLEMRADGGGQFWATLPKPEATTGAVEMYILGVMGDGTEVRSPVSTVPVTSSCRSDLTLEQERYAQNLVIGETDPAQAGLKVEGFLCDGIVWRIASTGDFRNDEACHDEMLAAIVEEGGSNITGFLTPMVLGAAGATVLIDEEDCPPVSPCVPCPVK